MFPVNVVKAENCRDELIKAIKEHLNNYVKKEENKYNGMITIINVGDNIPEETNEIVNDLCKIDVINEEVNEEKEKGKEVNKDQEKEEDKNNKK